MTTTRARSMIVGGEVVRTVGRRESERWMREHGIDPEAADADAAEVMDDEFQAARIREAAAAAPRGGRVEVMCGGGHAFIKKARAARFTGEDIRHLRLVTGE